MSMCENKEWVKRNVERSDGVAALGAAMNSFHETSPDAL